MNMYSRQYYVSISEFLLTKLLWVTVSVRSDDAL